MALLLATDDWRKMEVFTRHLAVNPKAVWRNRLNYSQDFLDNIHFPINLYFFHKSVIKYRARCIGISRGSSEDFPLKYSPIEYRSDAGKFTNGIFIENLEKVKDIHIREFPKWEDPGTHYQQGQLGLIRVVDIGIQRIKPYQI